MSEMTRSLLNHTIHVSFKIFNEGYVLQGCRTQSAILYLRCIAINRFTMEHAVHAVENIEADANVISIFFRVDI